MNYKIKELFRRYESGEATTKERELVELWFSKQDKVGVSLENDVFKDVDGRLDQLLDKPVRRLHFMRYAAVWAGIIMIAGFTLWQFTKPGVKDQIAFIERTNIKGRPVRYMLPDSSSVYLGAGSKLRYSNDFNGDIREIELLGEAFFQVKHDASKPFIIHTGEIQTQVLGTSFKVQAFKSHPVFVAVATGKVGVSRQDRKSSRTLALLEPGHTLTWNGKTGKAVEGTVEIYSLEQWKSGELVFEEQPMEQIALELQRRYSVQIEFLDKSIEDNQVSGTFPADRSVERVMNTLAVAGKFQYKTDDHKTFKIYRNK